MIFFLALHLNLAQPVMQIDLKRQRSKLGFLHPVGQPGSYWNRRRILVSNLMFFFDFLRPFAQLGFTKDLRLNFFSDLVSNLRLPRG